MLHQCNKRDSFIRGAHKTSSVLWLRHNPAPPNEEQFNAPTASGCAMKERIRIRIKQRKVRGAPKTIKQDNIIHRMLHQCNKRNIIY